MFNPSREQVRSLFFDTWRKYRQSQPLEGVESTALQVCLLHPEYHAMLESPERHAEREYFPEQGETNPFLHLSLHLALEEQLSINQPIGMAERFTKLLARFPDRHAALHAALECLAEMIWQAQRNAAGPDGEAYLRCLDNRGSATH